MALVTLTRIRLPVHKLILTPTITILHSPFGGKIPTSNGVNDHKGWNYMFFFPVIMWLISQGYVRPFSWPVFIFSPKVSHKRMETNLFLKPLKLDTLPTGLTKSHVSMVAVVT